MIRSANAEPRARLDRSGYYGPNRLIPVPFQLTRRKGAEREREPVEVRPLRSAMTGARVSG